MGTDAHLKRFFPAIVLVLLAIAGYFQASGLGHIVASSVAIDPDGRPAPTAQPRRAVTPAAVNPDHAGGGKLILARNPFDSITGPLDGERPSAPEPEIASDEPLPSCDAARVVLITWSEDPEWSFASIAGSDGKSTLRRKGDEMNGYTIDDISWDRVSMASRSGQRCEMVIGGKITATTKGGAGSPPPDRGPGGPGDKKPSHVPREIADKIHVIDPGHVEVERSVISQILENRAELMGSVRALPRAGGDGIRLSGIRPGSLLQSIGVQNGDRLLSVNGLDLSDPQSAMKAYPQLMTAEHLAVSLQRAGKPTSIDVHVK